MYISIKYIKIIHINFLYLINDIIINNFDNKFFY